MKITKLLLPVLLLIVLTFSVFATVQDSAVHYYSFTTNYSDIIGGLTGNPTQMNIDTNCGYVGTGAYFNGSGYVFSATSSSEHNFAQVKRTMCVWVKRLVDTNSMMVYSKSSAGGGGYRATTHTNSSSTISLYGASESWETHDVANYFQKDTWVYDCLVSNGSTSLKRYRNGVLTETIALWNGDWSSGNAFALGSHQDLPNNKFTGCLDEMTWYNSEMSQANLTILYNSYINNPPNITSFIINNTLPITTDQTVTAQFTVNDSSSSDLNISLTWYKSTDGGSTYTNYVNNQSWLSQTSVQYDGVTYYSTTGSLPPLATDPTEYWKASLIVSDGVFITYANTTAFYIDNVLPNITTAKSNTTNTQPALIGNKVLFNITGKHFEPDTITMKICTSPYANWSNCTTLCENLVGVTFTNTTEESITCEYTSGTETVRQNYGYGILYDTNQYTNTTQIDYYINYPPNLTNFTMATTTGDTTYFFGQSIDYFRISANDSYDGNLVPYITVTDPDGIIKVNNQTMVNVTGIVKGYENDLFLDAVGTWSVSIYVIDSDGVRVNFSTTFSVGQTTVSNTGRIYGYDFETLPSYSDLNSALTTYGYYLGEIRITKSTTWSDVLNLVALAKNNSQLVAITLYDDLSDMNSLTSYISTNYRDLIGANYLNGIRHLKFMVPSGTTVNSGNTAKINNVTKLMYQNVSNKLAILLREYNSSTINTNYVRIDTYPYIATNSTTTFINIETAYLRNSTTTSRMYYGMNTAAKIIAKDWQTNIIDNLRSTLTTPTMSYTNIAELTNGDFIITNNVTNQTFSITLPASYVGYDIYDLTTHKIIDRQTTGTISITLGSYNSSIIYKTNLSKITVDTSSNMYIYSTDYSNQPLTQDNAQNSDNAFQFVTSSANAEDAKLILTDPGFDYPNFYVWYGINGAEAIGNWSVYDYVILADTSNTTWVTNIAQLSNIMFGYTSVNTYGNNNYPIGCTPGVTCSSWNRTYWIQTKETEINVWTNIDTGVNIFIDGLDIGAVNDVDGLFSDALLTITDYVRVTKQRLALLNTYTSYENYANLGDYTMRESACGRWDGTVANPTYTYESISLDVQRANFHKAHGLTVFAQTFGNITDYKKSYYCYMQNKVLYGDLMVYGYNQPDFEYTGADRNFQWNYFKYPPLGAALQDDFTTDGDSYSRRFEKGIVTVNTTSHTVSWAKDTAVTQMQFCAYYYDNTDGPTNEGRMHYVFNYNLSRSFDVVDTDLTAFVKTWKCQNISTSNYEETGFYETIFYYLDDDATYLGNNGMYMYNGYVAGKDRLSFYDTVLDGHPPNTDANFVYYPTGQNWASNFTITSLSSGQSLDQLNSVITRTESGTNEQKTIKFSSNNHYDINIYDKLVFVNKSNFIGIRVSNGTGSVYLNTTNTPTCITSTPLYAVTNITTGSANGTWQSCWYNTTATGFYVSVIVPHLSDINYTIDGNTPPNVSNEVYTLLNLTNGNQTWRATFDYADADNNTITTCQVTSENMVFTSTPTTTCSITFTMPFNSTVLTAVASVYDDNGGQSSNGRIQNLTSIVYNGISTSPTVGNFTIQYFNKNWNITPINKVYSSIQFNYNGSSIQNIALTNTSINNIYFVYTTNLITVIGNYDYIHNANESYIVDATQSIFRNITIVGSLDTGETVPPFSITFTPSAYYGGTQAVYRNCTNYVSYTNVTLGTTITTITNTIPNGVTDCYKYVYDSIIVYSESGISYRTNLTALLTTYYFNNSLDNGKGRRIRFLFGNLNSSSTRFYDVIPYSQLTGWSTRLNQTLNVSKYYSVSSTYTDLNNGVGYNFTDYVASNYTEFVWANITTPYNELDINLTWTINTPVTPVTPSVTLSESCGSTKLIIFSAFTLISLCLIIGAAWLIISMFGENFDNFAIIVTVVSAIAITVVIMVGYVIIDNMIKVTCVV